VATLDVREDEVDSIIFAESDGHTNMLMLKDKGRYSKRVVEFMAGNEENGYDFKLEDIDNLIKALQKAKALWSE
jgi:hypothetical protein